MGNCRFIRMCFVFMWFRKKIILESILKTGLTILSAAQGSDEITVFGGWGDGLVSKMLAKKAWRPKFAFLEVLKALCCSMTALLLLLRWEEGGRQNLWCTWASYPGNIWQQQGDSVSNKGEDDKSTWDSPMTSTCTPWHEHTMHSHTHIQEHTIWKVW